MKKILRSFLILVWKNVDAVICLIIALIASCIGLWSNDEKHAISAMGAVLALLSFSIIRDREVRDKLNNKIMSFELPQNADDLLFKKSDEGSLIAKASNEIILVQESGRKIFEDYRSELTEFLKRGGVVKCIVVLGQDKNISKLMAFRNFDLYDLGLMEGQLCRGLDMIKLVQRNSKQFSKNLQIRFFPYPVDITGVFVDPKTSKRSALIRLQGFKLSYEEKPTLIINGDTSVNSFQLYHKQVMNMWKFSTKCVFLTGQAGIGKSTLLEKVIKKLEKESKDSIKLFGFVTKSIYKNEKRIGFQTMAIHEKKSCTLAERVVDRYILNESCMDELILPILEEGIKRDDINLVVIDEIGPIQLQSKKFQTLIEKLLSDHRKSVLGIIALPNEEDELIDRAINDYRTSLITVNGLNRDKLVDDVVEQFI